MAGDWTVSKIRAMPTPFIAPKADESYEWPPSPTLASRFHAKVDQRGEDECWRWLAFTRGDGYGMIRNGHRMATASRVAWVLSYGQIPPGLHVLHHCDHPSCCNPRHLYLGTNDDNIRDKVSRGRSHSGQPTKRGERSHYAKLTQSQVNEIRRRSTGTRGEGKALAAEFGVSRSAISFILNGKTWRPA